MSEKKSPNIDFLHHAYIIFGDRSLSNVFLQDFLTDRLKISLIGNPDVRSISESTLSIDSVRNIRFAEEVKDFGNSKKVFILETDFITEEAQNALLKIFEEPTKGTYFFVCLPQDTLLPTLRSRVHIINLYDNNKNNIGILSMSINDRMAKIKEILDNISDENATKQDAINFVNLIEKDLYNGGIEKNHQKIILCEYARASLFDRGAPVKMILESLVLSI